MESLPGVSLGGVEAAEALIRVMLTHPVMLPQSTWTGNRNYRAQPVAGATLLESKIADWTNRDFGMCDMIILSMPAAVVC